MACSKASWYGCWQDSSKSPEVSPTGRANSTSGGSQGHIPSTGTPRHSGDLWSIKTTPGGNLVASISSAIQCSFGCSSIASRRWKTSRATPKRRRSSCILEGMSLCRVLGAPSSCPRTSGTTFGPSKSARISRSRDRSSFKPRCSVSHVQLGTSDGWTFAKCAPACRGLAPDVRGVTVTRVEPSAAMRYPLAKPSRSASSRSSNESARATARRKRGSDEDPCNRMLATGTAGNSSAGSSSASAERRSVGAKAAQAAILAAAHRSPSSSGVESFDDLCEAEAGLESAPRNGDIARKFPTAGPLRLACLLAVNVCPPPPSAIDILGDNATPSSVSACAPVQATTVEVRNTAADGAVDPAVSSNS
mmetsp:Transcript_30738/g.89208  ORF Transcript_30738/g.89208 Transcript_30738/m.89208 type:complete len:362 (+) Transcript_30738:423-1508(+)